MRPVLLLLALALAAAGCDDDVTFSYFRVPVKLDRTTIDDELLDLIEACAAIAETPVNSDSGDLRCVRHRIPNDLGIFEYTTQLTSGAVKFTVVMNSYSGTTLARGELDPMAIMVGKTVTTPTLTVKAVPGAPREPPAGGTADGGAGN
jgi:hypothetical protein